MSETIILTPALSWSGALRRSLHGQPELASWLEQASAQPVQRQVIYEWFEELCRFAAPDLNEQGNPLHDVILPPDTVGIVLRHLRKRVFFTLMVRDINGQASLLEVVTASSLLADLAVAQAYRSVMHELVAHHGTPVDPATGLPQEMLIVGMGKLGGRELNVSSDIDLIMLYGADGTTAGARPISHHELYGRATRRIAALLSAHNAHGFVFRCDLRLRPDGSAGPLAWSLPALETYFIQQGREWERYAWIKARTLNCRAFADSQATQQAERLESMRVPFVYRNYFDFDALSALRSLRERIRQDWERRASQRSGVDKTHNIKLGDGGIREIEFVVQLNQLIRGGRLPSLQQRGLHPALYKQRKAGVLAEDVADRLEEAYFFLRRLEHRLQYREDDQTHMLPRDSAQRSALAATLGMDVQTFEDTLARHRECVHDIFMDAFRIVGVAEPQPVRLPEPPQQTLTDLARELEPRLDGDVDDIRARIDALRDSPRLRKLPAISRRRLDALVPAIMQLAANLPEPATTVNRLLDLIEHIASRSAYLALLVEYPAILERVARIINASPWAAHYLTRYPLLLDSLLHWDILMSPPDFKRLQQQLASELDACLLPDGQPDIEQQMNLMRDLQHQVTFRLLAQDLEGALTVEHLADHLSALADMLLEETIVRVWPLVQAARGAQTDASELAPPHFAIIGYGKLGGKELGYVSDLDLVFLYEDRDPAASERYVRLARRVSSWLSTLTSSGRLYDVDLRLRPDGDAGLLAIPFEAFAHYQTHNAWSWEHQALTRARFVAGNHDIGQRFEALREKLLLRQRDCAALRDDVIAMRDKISAGHPNHSSDFDIKHDRGGMVDVEFIIQYLILCHAHEHPKLLGNLGNIALLRIAAEAGLIPTGLATRVADAYRHYRQRQHALRLQGAERARLPSGQLQDERRAVNTLWNHILGEERPSDLK